jgi:hypothetical protein
MRTSSPTAHIAVIGGQLRDYYAFVTTARRELDGLTTMTRMRPPSQSCPASPSARSDMTPSAARRSRGWSSSTCQPWTAIVPNIGRSCASAP